VQYLPCLSPFQSSALSPVWAATSPFALITANWRPAFGQACPRYPGLCRR
jgi:hypothetical protein